MIANANKKRLLRMQNRPLFELINKRKNGFGRINSDNPDHMGIL